MTMHGRPRRADRWTDEHHGNSATIHSRAKHALHHLVPHLPDLSDAVFSSAAFSTLAILMALHSPVSHSQSPCHTLSACQPRASVVYDAGKTYVL